MAREYTKEVQQELMERSLRNVRGLVEKIEAEEAARKRTQKWVIGAIVAVSVLLVGVIAITVTKQPTGRPIMVSPDKPPAPEPAK
jgi:hypothetical protein